jgi:hypothetical protein
MKKLALALLAIFILPSSLSAAGNTPAAPAAASSAAPATPAPAAAKQGRFSVAWDFTKNIPSKSWNGVRTHKWKSLGVAALVAAVGAAIYYRDQLGCPCSSQKQKKA